MYRGFNVLDTYAFNENKYYTIGSTKYKNNKDIVENELEKYVGKDGILDGTKIKNDWFKKVDADIFISHSHNDEELAIKLAGWLKDTFELNSFIDSCVWGYANNLLKEIDNDYCKSDDGNYYNYDSRNFSTAHVHIMLSTALIEMIDKTECVFFINTPNSIYVKDDINNKTMSPWIYSELVTTQLIRKNKPNRPFNEDYIDKKAEVFSQKKLEIKYNINLDHLYDINYKGFESWKKVNNGEKMGAALDNLYSLLEKRKK